MKTLPEKLYITSVTFCYEIPRKIDMNNQGKIVVAYNRNRFDFKVIQKDNEEMDAFILRAKEELMKYLSDWDYSFSEIKRYGENSA